MYKSMMMAMILTPVLAISAFAIDKNHKALRVGEEGEVVVTRVLHMDGLTLQPGEYLLQHRRSRSEHFLQVQKLEVDPTPSEAYPQYIPVYEGTVKCKIEPETTKFRKTALITEKRGDQTWITAIEIAGEDAAHTIQ